MGWILDLEKINLVSQIFLGVKKAQDLKSRIRKKEEIVWVLDTF
jgi:hypothetical protein